MSTGWNDVGFIKLSKTGLAVKDSTQGHRVRFRKNMRRRFSEPWTTNLFFQAFLFLLFLFERKRLTSFLTTVFIVMTTYQVIKSSGHSFRVDPQLPFSGMPVPRLAHVIPFEQLLRVVYPVHSMSVDGQRVIRFIGRVFDPRVYDTRFTWICKEKNIKNAFKYYAVLYATRSVICTKNVCNVKRKIKIIFQFIRS